MHTVGGTCTIEQLSPPRPGGPVSYIAGLGSSVLATLQSASCAADPVTCLLNQVLGVPSAESQYQSWLHSLGVDTSAGSTYADGQASGDILSLAAGGLLSAAGAAGDAAAALSNIAPEDLPAAARGPVVFSDPVKGATAAFEKRTLWLASECVTRPR